MDGRKRKKERMKNNKKVKHGIRKRKVMLGTKSLDFELYRKSKDF